MQRFFLFLLSVILAIGLFFCTKDQDKSIGGRHHPAVTIKTIQPFYYVFLADVPSSRNHSNILQELKAQLQQQHIQPAGPIIRIQNSTSRTMETDSSRWIVGVPVTDSLRVKVPLRCGKWGFTRVASLLADGSYPQNKEGYKRLKHFLRDKNLPEAGPLLERNLNHSSQIPPENFPTEIWIPVE